MRELCPIWRDLEIACKGKYLGFILGPKASQDGWTEPLAKFESQVNFWATMRLGMAMNIVAHCPGARVRGAATPSRRPCL